MTGFDVIIAHGLIVDGTGGLPRRGHVGVREGRVTMLSGDVSQWQAAETIDATGLYVSPGFIDAHSHSDLAVLDDPLLASKVYQGVTTEVVGVDGLSYAPFASRGDLDAFVLQNGGIAGIPEELPTWRSVGEQLEAYTGAAAVNMATFVGNTPLWVNAVGWTNAPLSRSQEASMLAQLREAMDEGALGLSTGLDYPPGAYASTDELVSLASIAAEFGGRYHTHVRYSLGDRYLDPFREALEISTRSGAGLQITHFSRSGRQDRPEGAQRLLDFVDESLDNGADVVFDTYPYEWGGTRLARLLPVWVQEGHPSRLRERLVDRRNRDRIRNDILASEAVGAYAMSKPFSDVRVGNFTEPGHRHLEGRYLTEICSAVDLDLADTIVELVASNPAATFTRPAPHAMTLWKFVCHRAGMIASDAVLIGDAASPRAFGCFSRVLSDFVREERLLSLPEAVRKMTSFPAHSLGLRSRGLLVDGYIADIAVFDLDAVRARATYESPRALAEGMRHVLVGGTAVLRDGVHTGATPGRGIRRQDS